ncbi:MAG: aspartate--tRNA ligase [Planctomycetes bacterium]|nr:aspartate--tRNA ligase [Planctomycetota bacterium]
MSTPAAAAQRRPGDWRRTHTCGALRLSDAGATVTLNGWVHARRDHGGIYFVDLRDRYGLTQVVLDEKLASSVRFSAEYVLSVTGTVKARDAQNRNAERATGEIEVVAARVEVLSASPNPPFEVSDDIDTALETRLRYRWLDLRRPLLQKNLLHRSRFINAIRRSFERQGFAEIETPILTKATPEGARDYLVPARVHPGKFYALPQSPQIFKQLLMVAGMDRYFQVARCFRDEDLRADRQPEFTQLDMEMSFVEEEDVFACWERVLSETFAECMGLQIKTPFKRLHYDEAQQRYGSDKPDTRFGLELKALDAWARQCEFNVFKSVTAQAGGRVMGISVPADLAAQISRKDLDTELTDHAKSFGAKGLAWWRPAADGGAGPLAKFAAGEQGLALRAALGAKDGDLCLFAAGPQAQVLRVLGELRNLLGRKFGLAKASGIAWDFLWVTGFPMFLRNEENGRWESAHHPFTAPADWNFRADDDAALGKLESRAYDLVMNGWELGSGSIRIHREEVQQRVFGLLGIGPDEQREKFGFLLEALAHGAPPHGGFAVGLDRLTALTAGLDNIREITAFPKTASAADLMCQAPSRVADAQLAEVHVARAGKGLEEGA